MMAATTSSSSSGSSSDPFAAPGFRFYPTEEELLAFYLRHRLAGTRPDVERVIPVVDVYAYHPSQLAAMAGEASVRDTEQWFFFCPRAERELHGGRPARTTPSGYWKATGSPSCVISSATNRVIGVKRTMVFYHGRAPTGTKTRWKMNEYKAVADDHHAAVLHPMAPPGLRNELGVCRVYISTGTLRSFDRRPLDNQAAGAFHPQAPSSSATATANTSFAGARGDNSRESSSSGSRELVGDGPEDDAIDWSSLISSAAVDGGDDFGLIADGFNPSILGSWPQL
ncbi:NAC domain-containing protein 90-like [Oryza brachyantha]|uniref:NAC domain-containing protein n=1 Tax=Oryza brachyantha TaxID=4533 RepID=J3N647_ORYBR|nr:NAC domain-containing protein 90-like [Oryza brachyantha]